MNEVEINIPSDYVFERIVRDSAGIQTREARSAKHHEGFVESQIDAGRLNLQLGIFQRLHHQVTLGEPFAQVSIGENHGMASIMEVA